MKSFGVVLAAGLGTRLRPSTLACPKPLIPVAGVEPLFFALYKFYQMGIRKVFVNTHYLDFRIREKLNEWKNIFPSFEIYISHENEILGTGGALLKIISEHADKIKDHQMILQNGDTLAGIDLDGFSKSPEKNHFAISLLPEHLSKYKPLWVDASHHWTGIGKTPPTQDSSPAHFLGIHSLSPKAVSKLLELLKNETIKVEESDLFNGIYRPLVTEGFQFEALEFFKSSLPRFDFWFDMTSKEFLLEAQAFILKHLPDLQIWRDLICSRYPGISQKQPGVWTLGQAPECFNLRAPALLILRHRNSLENFKGKISLGPFSAFIFEGQKLDLKSSQDLTEIENGVFYVQDSQTSPIQLEGNIQGALFIK